MFVSIEFSKYKIVTVHVHRIQDCKYQVSKRICNAIKFLIVAENFYCRKYFNELIGH